MKPRTAGLLAAAAMGGSLTLWLPADALRVGWPGTQAALLLDAALAALVAAAMVTARRRCREESVLAWWRTLVGLPLAWVGVVAHLLLYLGLAALLVRGGVEVMRLLLPRTPPAFSAGSLLAVSAYTASGGARGLARAIQILLLVIAPLYLVLFVLGMLKADLPGAMLPGLPARAWDLLRMAAATAYVFLGLSTAWFFLPRAGSRQVLVGLWRAVGATVLAALLLTEAVLGLFGPWFAVRLQWPAVTAVRAMAFSGLIVERFGVLVATVWPSLTAVAVSVLLAAGSRALGEAGARRVSLSARLSLVASTVFLLALWPGDVGQLEGWCRAYLVPGGTAFTGGWAALLAVAARARGPSASERNLAGQDE